MLLSILPVASIGLLGVFYLFIAVSTGGSPLFAVPMLMMGVITVSVALITYFSQRTEQRKTFLRKRRDYNRQLDRRVERLQAVRELQVEALADTFPPPARLLERVRRLDLTLWNRRPEDPDFLEVRFGTGTALSSVPVRPPDPDIDAPDMRRAMNLVFGYKWLPNTAITVNLLRAGALGVIGSRVETVSFAYNVLVQLATYHTPVDLDIYIFSSQVGYFAWSWTRWLPHTSKGSEGGFPDLVAFGDADVYALLDSLARRADARRGQGDEGERDTGVIFALFDHLTSLQEETAFKSLLQSRDVGIVAMCLNDTLADVPTECAGIVEIADGQFTLRMTGPDAGKVEGSVDTMNRAQAEQAARQFANVTLHQEGDSGRVPTRSNFLQLFDVPSLARLGVRERWRRPVPAKGLLPFPVPVGHTTYSSHLMFDLSEHAHGPHGVVAGTTGSGKSELLQTLVSSLAVEHHPYLLNFLLIDYKGGATFNVFRDLPHTAGIITNLNVVEALRALEAIRSENRRRQIFLAEQNAEDITDYYKRLGRAGGQIPPDWVPLPHLVIIIDEFAELKAELPNFLDELVATVRVGRSLGMHLILATQRPAGHVTQEMSANLNFRISLRVQNPEESREMIRRPDAAFIPPSVPGRAYFLVGNDLQEFQASWVGMEYDEAAYANDTDEAPVVLRVLRREHASSLSGEASRTQTARPADTAIVRIPTLAEALSTQLTREFVGMGIAPTETVFLESLPDALPLEQVLDAGAYGGWDGETWRSGAETQAPWVVPVGFVDDIANRSQPPFAVDFPGLGGHIMVAGGPGTGKTTFLRTLALSLAHLYRPDQVEMYVLSLTGRALDMLEGLPHVGAVVRNDENERFDRLFRRLFNTLEARRYTLAQLNADDLLQYNSRITRQGGQPLPAIFVLVDNFVELQKAFLEEIDTLVTLMRDARAVGIYFAMTTPTINVSYKVMNLIQQRLALRLTERSDYLQFIGRNEGREVNPRPGSGLLSGKPLRHIQLALPADGEDDDFRLEAMQATIAAMAAAWGDRPKAEPIVTLPDTVLLEHLLPAAPTPPPDRPDSFQALETLLGVESTRLQPYRWNWLEEGPHLLINGPVASGKSSLLRTLLLGVAARYSPAQVQMLLVDFNQQSLSRLGQLPHVIATVMDEDALAQQLYHMASELNWRTAELQRRKTEGTIGLDDSGSLFPPLILAIDDYDQLRDALTTSYTQLVDLSRFVRADRRLGLHFIVAGESSGLTSGTDRLIKQIRLMRSGVGLVTPDAIELLGARVTRAMRQIQLPNGRGYTLSREGMSLIQFAHLQDPTGLVRELVGRWQGHRRAVWAHPASGELPKPSAAPAAPAASKAGGAGFDFSFDMAGALDDYKKQQARTKQKG
jgi:S-DNA-T family DNA segregation ATPase FtsK/SpoIIIE